MLDGSNVDHRFYVWKVLSDTFGSTKTIIVIIDGSNGQNQDKQEYHIQRRRVEQILREKKHFYKDGKGIKKEYQNLPPYIKSKDGKLIGSEEIIVERWKDHLIILLIYKKWRQNGL